MGRGRLHKRNIRAGVQRWPAVHPGTLGLRLVPRAWRLALRQTNESESEFRVLRSVTNKVQEKKIDILEYTQL